PPRRAARPFSPSSCGQFSLCTSEALQDPARRAGVERLWPGRFTSQNGNVAASPRYEPATLTRGAGSRIGLPSATLAETQLEIWAGATRTIATLGRTDQRALDASPRCVSVVSR